MTTPTSSSPSKARTVFIIGAVVAVAVGIFFAMKSGNADTQTQNDTPLVSVETQVLKRQTTYQSEALYPGRIRAVRRSQLGFERGGMLASVAVDDGQRIAAGTIMAQLDQRALEAERAAAQAAVDDAKANAQLAAATAKRQTSLQKKGNSSKQRLDESTFGAQSATARAATAQAQLEAVKVALTLSQLIAPFDGIVVQRMADEGTVLAPGTPIFDFEETGAREFVTGVPADVVGTMKPGDQFTVVVGGERLAATLKDKVAALDTATRTAQLILSLPPEATAVSGQVGQLVLSARNDAAGFWVPLEALQEGQRGLWSVLVAAQVTGSEDASLALLERHPVELLHAEMGRAFVRGSIEGGDKLVVSGLNRLISKQQVRIASASGR